MLKESSRRIHPQSIALIGLSGTGKSTVARILAQQLDWSLIDIDAAIVELTGRSIAALFAEDGESYFRDIESVVLESALANGPAIVATGAGVVVRRANCTALRQQATCVWLDGSTEQLVARLLAHTEKRPLLSTTTLARSLDALRTARSPLYAMLADVIITTDEMPASAIVERIVAKLDLTRAVLIDQGISRPLA